MNEDGDEAAVSYGYALRAKVKCKQTYKYQEEREVRKMEREMWISRNASSITNQGPRKPPILNEAIYWMSA